MRTYLDQIALWALSVEDYFADWCSKTQPKNHVVPGQMLLDVVRIAKRQPG